jgi:hypothetical protein
MRIIHEHIFSFTWLVPVVERLSSGHSCYEHVDYL